MSGSLEGVYAKIDRAESHLEELEKLTRETARKCRDALVGEYDRERSRHVFRLMEIPEIDPRFPLILGDAVHNLRTALDHLAWQLVIATGTEAPNTETKFPVKHLRPKKPDPSGSLLPQIQPGVSQAVREHLDAVQPYQRKYPANHQLAVLHTLDIIDKHRRLVVAVIELREGVGWFGEFDLVGLHQRPAEPGDEVGAFVGEPDVPFQPQFRFAESFDEPKAGALRYTYGAASLIRNEPLAYMRNEVLPRFREFFPAGGDAS